MQTNDTDNRIQTFTTQLRVRHYEMDPLGHVNNAVYQNYLEQAAVEHSEHLGISLERCRELGGVFVMRHIKIDYLRPAVAGDTLEVRTWLQKMKGASVTRRYEIRRLEEDPLLVTAEAVWAWVDVKTMRPRGIPREIVEVFERISQPKAVG